MKRTILISGGAGGIGAAISRKFAAEGYAVIITYNRNADKARALRRALSGEDHACLQVSIDDSRSIDKLARQVEAQYGKLDVIITANN